MLEIIIIFICLSLNGILACAETAFVAVNKAALRQKAKKGNVKAQMLLRFRENPERTLAVLQVGITFLAFLGAAFGGSGAAEYIAPKLKNALHIHQTLAVIIANLLIVVPLTYLNVVFAELVPKTLALKRSMFFSLATVKSLNWAQKIFNPLITFLESSIKKTLNLLKIFTIEKRESDEEGQIFEIGGLEPSSKQFIFNISDLEQKTLKDVLIPWDSVVSITETASEKKLEELAISSGHTRIPVVSDGEIRGILHTKEFFVFQKAKEEKGETWTILIRPALQYQANDMLLTAFREMQEKQTHMAIIYEGVTIAGITTLEDIIEQVVGEIYDEDDDRDVIRFLRSQKK